MKKYQVFIQDEWNNLWLMGFYNKLNDSIQDINDFLEPYDTKIDELKEYSSTFGSCFDTEVETKTGEFVTIRGFIFDGELLEEIKQCLI